MNLKCLLLGIAIGVYAEAAEAFDYAPERTSASVSIKVPGINPGSIL